MLKHHHLPVDDRRMAFLLESAESVDAANLAGGCGRPPIVGQLEAAGGWRRPAHERRAARRRAADAADNAVRRLTAEAASWKKCYLELASALGRPGVAERLAVAAPALATLEAGYRPGHEE